MQIECGNADILKLPFDNNYLDAGVLNMGTISDFDDATKNAIIKELLRVCRVVYLDFYPPTADGLAKRKKMYEEEGWSGVFIEGNCVKSKDGLYSVSLSRDDIARFAEDLDNIEITFYTICDFAEMAEIKKRT